MWLKYLINSIIKLIISYKLTTMIKSYMKICPNCRWRKTKKDGKRRWKQSYRCHSCRHVRVSRSREKKKRIERLYKEYATHKQTYQELSERTWMNIRTIQRKLDTYKVRRKKAVVPTEIILLIDTTYIWDFGLMLFKDAYWPKLLHHEYVKYETNNAYRSWVKYLQEQGWKIKAIVCDGRKWLLWWFGIIPTQMCHFHQKAIMRRYITKNPTLEPNKELNIIVSWLCKTEKECLEKEIERWYEKHVDFIKERKRSPTTGKMYYVHKRTRSAYYSLKRNMKYLFVWQEYMNDFDIPNTTNGIESEFSHLKPKIHLHRWLRSDRKRKLIDYLLYTRY